MRMLAIVVALGASVASARAQQACDSAADPRLGVTLLPLTADLREYFGAPLDRGVLVARVVPGSAAEADELRAGDVIVAIDGQPATDPIVVVRALSAQRPTSIDLVRDKATVMLALSP